jgi:hypothetical protein
VQAEFTKNGKRVFDLVIGADGLHSNVRALVLAMKRALSAIFACICVCTRFRTISIWMIRPRQRRFLCVRQILRIQILSGVMAQGWSGVTRGSGRGRANGRTTGRLWGMAGHRTGYGDHCLNAASA